MCCCRHYGCSHCWLTLPTQRSSKGAALPLIVCNVRRVGYTQRNSSVRNEAHFLGARAVRSTMRAYTPHVFACRKWCEAFFPLSLANTSLTHPSSPGERHHPFSSPGGRELEGSARFTSAVEWLFVFPLRGMERAPAP